MDRGYIQVYTGNGKGKTTAALGLGLRASGRGLKVIMIQFLKGRFTGEIEAVKKLAPNFHIIRFAQTDKFVSQLSNQELKELKDNLSNEMQKLHKYIDDDMCDVLILDEVMGAIKSSLVSVKEICTMMDKKPEEMELVLTGRDVPDEIAVRSDLITEMRQIKHYVDKGVHARIGIEI